MKRYCDVKVLSDPREGEELGGAQSFVGRVISIEASLLDRLIQEEIWAQTGWPIDEVPIAEQLRLLGVRLEPSRILSDEERTQVIAHLKDQCLDWWFGDGMEEQYIMDGFPVHKGLSNMTDDELLRELGHYNPTVDDTPEKRAEAWRREQRE